MRFDRERIRRDTKEAAEVARDLKETIRQNLAERAKQQGLEQR